MISLALLVSCEKEIEFNGEQSDPKLVINSLVEPGQPVKACISKSYFFLDTPNTTTPADLVAKLYVNDNYIGEMAPCFDTVWEYNGLEEYYLIPNFYNDYRPQVGDIVKITASAHGFDVAEGVTSALPQNMDCPIEVEIVEWDAQYIYPYYDGDDYEEDSLMDITGTLNVTFVLTDPNPGKRDYFRLILDQRDGDDDGENWYFADFDYDDPIFGANFSENDLVDISDLDTRPEGVFTDMLFDGTSYRLKLKVRFNCQVDEYYDPDFFRVMFKLEHLSKEYYNYLNTCDQSDEFNQFFAEPIQTYSNVTNGFGIVAGRAMDTLWMSLPLSE